MNHISNSKFKGRVLFVDQDIIYRAYKNLLYKSMDSGNSWEEAIKLPIQGIKNKMGYSSHLSRRLLRLGIHHFLPSTTDSGLIIDKSAVILEEQVLRYKNQLTGSRPLSLEKFENDYIFGEYRSNPERSPIHIWKYGKKSGLISIFELQGIRHIHGIYEDPYTSNYWITTGDEDHEAAIYCSKNNLKTIEKVLFGSQQTRTIKLLFTKDFIYFGSDAPYEVNYLYRLHRESKKVERLQEVGSSVFHGCKVGDWLFFSTAVEPSEVNTTKFAEVWASPNGTDWKCIYKFKKDILPMRYFQYGQVFFPNGSGDDKNLWISPFATQYDNITFKIGIDQIESRFKQC